jgi:hypothetical protein
MVLRGFLKLRKVNKNQQISHYLFYVVMGCFNVFWKIRTHFAHIQIMDEFIESLIRGVEELTGINLTLDDVRDVRQELITILLITAHKKGGELTDSEAAKLYSLTDRVRQLQMQVKTGDSDAELKLRLVEKLTDSPKMIHSQKKKTTPFITVVKDALEGYKTSPHFVHVGEIRKLMSQLSYIVKPICSCSKKQELDNWLSLKTDLSEEEKKLIRTDNADFVCSCNTLKPESKVELRKRVISRRVNLIEEAETVFKKGTKRENSRLTLELLAKKIYLRRIENENSEDKTDINSLNRSLREVELFEKMNPDLLKRRRRLQIFNGEDIFY